ncbi:MAG: ferritin-like domain-containing protein [Thermoplasmata archaeon]
MSKELIDNLNKALSDEITRIITYLNQSFMVFGPSRNALHESLEKIAINEMKHMELLSERIVGLGGVPTVKSKEVEQTNVIEKMLKMDADDERDAIETYKKIREIAKKENEIPTVNLIEQIMMDEQEHLDEINKMLRKNPS